MGLVVAAVVVAVVAVAADDGGDDDADYAAFAVAVDICSEPVSLVKSVAVARSLPGVGVGAGHELVPTAVVPVWWVARQPVAVRTAVAAMAPGRQEVPVAAEASAVGPSAATEPAGSVAVAAAAVAGQRPARQTCESEPLRRIPVADWRQLLAARHLSLSRNDGPWTDAQRHWKPGRLHPHPASRSDVGRDPDCEQCRCGSAHLKDSCVAVIRSLAIRILDREGMGLTLSGFLAWLGVRLISLACLRPTAVPPPPPPPPCRDWQTNKQHL